MLLIFSFEGFFQLTVGPLLQVVVKLVWGQLPLLLKGYDLTYIVLAALW